MTLMTGISRDIQRVIGVSHILSYIEVSVTPTPPPVEDNLGLW